MPITPVFEQPPAVARTKGIDWTDTIAALVEHPGEWAKVDGPFPDDKSGRSKALNHGASLRRFAARAGHTIETQRGSKDGEAWLYARLVAEDQAADEPEQPEGKAAHPAASTTSPTKKTRPVAAVPDPPKSPALDVLGDDALTCDICGDRFRTNTRLRQHQANAHKAS